MTKRSGAQRHNYKKQTFLPSAEFKFKKVKTGHWVFDKDGNKVEKGKEKQTDVPAVHDDRTFSAFDWGAGKNWADHGGRAGRREWMKRGDGTGSFECKG